MNIILSIIAVVIIWTTVSGIYSYGTTYRSNTESTMSTLATISVIYLIIKWVI